MRTAEEIAGHWDGVDTYVHSSAVAEMVRTAQREALEAALSRFNSMQNEEGCAPSGFAYELVVRKLIEEVGDECD